MDFKEIYQKLYKHWLKEFKQVGLTLLTQELFNYFTKNLNFIENIKKDQTNLIKRELVNSYQDNYKFLFHDFLKIREIKIINAALSLKEIDLNNLIEAELLFYQNLVGTIKGFKKMKGLTLFEGEVDDYIKGITKEKELDDTIAENAKEIPQGKIDITSILDLAESKEGNDQKYILIRFLRETPPLVGVDLKNYGPFDKEDIANLPIKNAKILLSEKFAEKIELD